MDALCGKQAFATPEAASRQMARVSMSSWVGQSANVYECDNCGMWHWGHYYRVDKALARANAAHSKAKWPPRIHPR